MWSIKRKCIRDIFASTIYVCQKVRTKAFFPFDHYIQYQKFVKNYIYIYIFNIYIYIYIEREREREREKDIIEMNSVKERHRRIEKGV